MLNLILFGPPGSGKGTQATKLREEYNLIHISTGDLLRSEMQKNTQLGNEAKAYITAGKLVPDEVVIGMISQKLDENKTQNPAGYIFDGFPRTVPQAEALDKLLLEKATPISKVLSLIVSDAELIERLSERGKSSGRADDSNVDVIKNRIKVYFDETLPVSNHYKKQDKLYEIHGEGNIDAIFNALCTAISA
jgi:adenylate kinase